MADKFLELVAQDLLQTYGNNLSQVTVVIPGKRARLFMNQYLAMHSDKPVWSPRYQTIDELFLELSPYHKAEQIETICLLYRVYSQLIDDPRPLDEFYSWGEIILSDFDDIDKHLAPAEKIFANVYDLHAIQEEYLTPEQETALSEFFSNFSIEKNTELKRRFLRLWQIMPRLYEGLRKELMQRGYLYSGALYRDVVERYKKDGAAEKEKLDILKQRQYAIVGFNVVDECEESLFRLLDEDHTRFYWDYDEMYMKESRFSAVSSPTGKAKTYAGSSWEAGLFIRQNLKTFPNRLPRECFNNLGKLKDITFIATSTDNAQARFIPNWIDQQLTQQENETAIVLCDEHMLQPVMHALPEDKPKLINITMGFPLTDTPIYSFLSIVTSMQIEGWDAAERRFRNTFVEKVKRHPYFPKCDEEKLFIHQGSNIELLEYLRNIIGEIGAHSEEREAQSQAPAETSAGESLTESDEEADKRINVYQQLYNEALYQAHKVVNRFITIIEEGTLDVHPITLRRLMRNVLSATSIPFHGEPAIGMQVMGLMETRNLDFKHLLMMNVGEGTMPKKSDDNSLIPYPLREAFGLTTIRHRISVFAYYFFRLLQRAEHVTLMYNENSSGVKSNEMSRFMRQLMAETDLPIRHIRLTPTNDPEEHSTTVFAEKTGEIIEKLKEKYSKKILSPTAINTYLDCTMRFYFKYVAEIVPQEQPEDNIRAVDLGKFFHNTAEKLYTGLQKKYHTKTLTADMLRPILEHKEQQLLPILEEVMHELGFESKSGLPLITRNVTQEYLCKLIKYDILHAPVTIESLEQKYCLATDISQEGEEPLVLNIGGIIDRLDQTEEGYQVIDYKTGGHPDSIKDIETIFTHEAKNAGYYLQTILYSLAISEKYHRPVKPSLFYVHCATKPNEYDPSLAFKPARGETEPILDVKPLKKEFMERLTDKLRELFNPNINFTQAKKEDKCTYCDYQSLCGKKIKKY